MGGFVKPDVTQSRLIYSNRTVKQQSRLLRQLIEQSGIWTKTLMQQSNIELAVMYACGLVLKVVGQNIII